MWRAETVGAGSMFSPRVLAVRAVLLPNGIGPQGSSGDSENVVFGRRDRWRRFLLVAANLAGMERAEAEAIYDSGRDACVQFILGLADRVRELDER